MQRSAGRRDLGQPSLDRRMDVLVGFEERERPGIELLADAPEPPLDRGQLRGGDDAGSGEAARMGDAAGDVKGVELVIGVEGR
jgi:hypothetical protein